MRSTTKNIIIAAWKGDIWLRILTITAILLIVGSFLCPPLGVVDSSVLLASGELFAFGALWELKNAVKSGANTKIRVKELEMEIKKKEEDA